MDDRYRAELACGISLLFLVLSGLFAVQTTLDPGSNPRLPLLCSGGALLFASNLVLLHRRSTGRAAGWALSIQLLVLLSVAAPLSRGYRLYSSGWELCVPLLVMFLVGVRYGAICAVILALEGVGLWLLEAHAIFVPFAARIEPKAQVTLITCGGMVLLVIGIGVIYERTHEARRSVLSATIEQLQAAHRDLATAQRTLIVSEKLSSLGLLAAGVAHEINNPMAYVTSNLAGLQRDLASFSTDPRLLAEYADEVIPATIDGIRRVNAIVADLRRFARGDPESFVEYDLNAEIGAAMRMAQGELKRRQTQTDINLANLPLVLGLPRQIMQVVLNLVINAAQATAVGGTVRVVSRAGKDEVKILVQDTGIGMSQETVSKLFQPFFTTKPIGEGTGLGLALVHGIVAAHGGRIEVESSPGTGSGFTVILPLVPPIRLPSAGNELSLN